MEKRRNKIFNVINEKCNSDKSENTYKVFNKSYKDEITENIREVSGLCNKFDTDRKESKEFKEVLAACTYYFRNLEERN